MAGSGSCLEKGEDGSYCEQRKVLIIKECFPPTTTQYVIEVEPAGTIMITRIVYCSSVAEVTTADERILEVVVAMIVIDGSGWQWERRWQ